MEAERNPARRWLRRSAPEMIAALVVGKPTRWGVLRTYFLPVN
jgi:hypothetical protein